MRLVNRKRGITLGFFKEVVFGQPFGYGRWRRRRVAVAVGLAGLRWVGNVWNEWWESQRGLRLDHGPFYRGEKRGMLVSGDRRASDDGEKQVERRG